VEGVVIDRGGVDGLLDGTALEARNKFLQTFWVLSRMAKCMPVESNNPASTLI
jgi:hypothetical protein